MRKVLVAKSKFISMVLRHDPGAIGLSLDHNGWADIADLLAKAAAGGSAITRAELEEIVETSEKKRFELDAAGSRIRASHGHSVEVDVELAAAEPPEELFHGSAVQNVDSILAKGLIRGERQHVHLAAEVATALRVGSRHGRPVVFRVASGAMHRRGFVFYLSKSGVWLTREVPAEFVENWP